MITKTERNTLDILARNVKEANDLCVRYNQSQTNHTLEHCELQHVFAHSAYNEFLNQITEKPMEYDNMCQHETQEQRLGSGRTPPANPSFQLKAVSQVYELSIPDLQKLFAKELCVPEDTVTLSAYMQEGQEGPGGFAFAGLKVTVKRH